MLIEYGKAHKDRLCLNTRTVKFLQPNEKYLLGDKNGPLCLGEKHR